MSDAPLWHARAYQMARDGYSLKQIAHACGVSTTTVSRLLYPEYRRQQAKGRRRRHREKLAADPGLRARENERVRDLHTLRRLMEKEIPDGP